MANKSEFSDHIRLLEWMHLRGLDPWTIDEFMAWAEQEGLLGNGDTVRRGFVLRLANTVTEPINEDNVHYRCMTYEGEFHYLEYIELRDARKNAVEARRFALISIVIALLAIAGGSLGCAFGEIRWSDPLQREISLEESQHRYTVLVRFGDFEKASGFVEPALRDEYLANFPDFREIRFTEYDSGRVAIDSAKATATIEVRYYAYTPASPIEMTVSETQEWYRAPGFNNHWYVRSTFTGLAEILALQ